MTTYRFTGCYYVSEKSGASIFRFTSASRLMVTSSHETVTIYETTQYHNAEDHKRQGILDNMSNYCYLLNDSAPTDLVICLVNTALQWTG